MPDMDSNRTFYDRYVQTMARDELQRLQWKRLEEAVQRAHSETGFFRKRFDAAGVGPADLASLADVRILPTFRKQDLRASEAAFPPIGDYRAIGLKGSVRLATSTGTTGRPTIMIWNQHDLEIDYELAARRYWRDGVRPGQVIVNAHPGYLNGGQSMLAGTAERIGCLPISIGPPSDDELLVRALRTIEDVPIDHWHTLPAGAARIREVAQRIGWKGRLPEEGAVTPMRQYAAISAGMECVGTLGGSCDPASYRGAHLAEDHAIVEAIDDRGNPVPDGTRGRFICTSLGRLNPMIRFDLEEIIRIDGSPCECGETHRRAFWEGRQKDLLTVQGKWVLPIDVWFELQPGQEFVLVRTGDEQDRLQVRVEDPVPDYLTERLRERIGVPVDVQRVERGTLTRAAYKAERVVTEPAR
jgi:phenylacetate-CoA ligase